MGPIRTGSGNGDIEVQNLFQRPQLLVQRESGLIAVVGLNVDHARPARRGDDLQPRDESRCYPLPAMSFGNSQVIDGGR